MGPQSAKAQGVLALLAVPALSEPEPELGSVGRPEPRAIGVACAAAALAGLPLIATALSGGADLVPREAVALLQAGAGLLGVLAAFAVFAVQWHATRTDEFGDARARFLGISFLGVAAVESAQLLTRVGVDGWMLSAQQGVFYGIAARIWISGALLGGVLVPLHCAFRLLRRPPLVVATAVIALGVLVAGAAPPRDPLRTALGGASVAISILAAVLHLREYRRTGDGAWLRLAAALGLGVLAAVCFILDGGPLYLLLGHAYDAASSWLVFGALFTAAVVRPYQRLGTSLAEMDAKHTELKRLGRRVEEELQETTARLRRSAAGEKRALAELEAAIAAVPDGLVVYGPDGGIRRLNGAADAMLGYPPGVKEWPFEARWRSLRPETRDGKPIPVEQSPLARALAGERVVGQLVAIHPPNHKPLWISVSAAPVRGPNGALHGAVASMADTSALQALEGLREELLSAVAQGLGGPLQLILFQADQLQRLAGGDPSSRARRAADAVADATRRMDAMIRDLLDSARIAMGLLRLAAEPVRLAPFAAQSLARAGLPDADRVKLAVPERLPPVAADPVRLDRIFVNLVSYLLQLSSAPAEVHVVAAEAFGDVVVSVTDRGQGLATEDLPRILEGSHRGTVSWQSRPELYVARLLVEAHGGSIWAHSRPEAGTTVTFTLPQVRSA